MAALRMAAALAAFFVVFLSQRRAPQQGGDEGRGDDVSHGLLPAARTGLPDALTDWRYERFIGAHR
jgi:hypothetical protein